MNFFWFVRRHVFGWSVSDSGNVNHNTYIQNLKNLKFCQNSTLSKSQIMPLPTWNVNFLGFLKFELSYVTPYTRRFNILHRDRHFVHAEHDVWNVPKIILSLKSLNKAKNRRFISSTIPGWSMLLMIGFIRLKV